MNEKILELLRDRTTYISGEEISKHLGISRSAIWKHIQELRQQGYEIVAVPHLGYELASVPDRLLPSEISHGLDTKIVGKEIYYYEMIPSTMDIAMDLGMKGCKEGVVVCAEGQYKGRGRLSRFWSSPKNKGVYISIILKPEISPSESPKLTLISAVGVCQAIRKITNLDCYIKWPNDLILNNKKLGGILTEMTAEMDMVKFVTIGIGINVNTPESLLIPKSVSLRQALGKRVSRIDLTQQILREIEREYFLFQKSGFAPIVKKWKELSTTLGHRVRVQFRKEYLEGEAVDIDSDGALLIKRDSGFVERVTAGDIVKVK